LYCLARLHVRMSSYWEWEESGFTAGLVLPKELRDRDQPTAPHIRRIPKRSAAYIKARIRKVGDLTST